MEWWRRLARLNISGRPHPYGPCSNCQYLATRAVSAFSLIQPKRIDPVLLKPNLSNFSSSLFLFIVNSLVTQSKLSSEGSQYSIFCSPHKARRKKIEKRHLRVKDLAPDTHYIECRGYKENEEKAEMTMKHKQEEKLTARPHALRDVRHIIEAYSKKKRRQRAARPRPEQPWPRPTRNKSFR